MSGRNSSASTTRRTGSLFCWREDDSSESDNPSRINPNQSYSLPLNRGSGRSYSGFDNDIPMKIGRIVNSWKVSFPKTERNPEQFLLILKDCLSTSGIHRDFFIPCLSKIFEGPYRSCYLVNKKLWRTWREFARAFRYEWGVKKDDADLLLEVHELKLDNNETLAEFVCRARLIFKRMQYPPEFKERLKQILTKFNPRLTFEILNLSLKSYTELLHYVNERSYLYQRSVESQQMRPRSNRADLSYVQDQFDSADEPDEYLIHDELKSSDENIESEQAADFNVFQPKRTVNSKKEFKVSNSKSLTRQRLDQNLDKFQGKLNQADITSKIFAKIPVDE